MVLGVRPDHVFSKVRCRDKGGGQYQGAGKRNYVTHVDEAGCLLEVDLAGYLDTGLFLDHRDTRAMVRSIWPMANASLNLFAYTGSATVQAAAGGRWKPSRWTCRKPALSARGTRFLNLFAYTGTGTCYAADGGAFETTTVDISGNYLKWARRNMEQNGFTGPEHMFERGDVMNWITQCRRNPRRFDLIFVDPPTFSNSKAMGKRTWDVQRDHVELLVGVSRLLTKGGIAVFSCNLRSFKPDFEQLEKYGVELEDITAQTIPHLAAFGRALWFFCNAIN